MALRRPLLLPRFYNHLRRKFCNGAGGSDIKKLFVEELSRKLNAVGTLQQKKKEKNVYKNLKEPVRNHAHKNRMLELKEVDDLESAMEKNREWRKINQNKKKEKKTSAKMEQKKEEEGVPSRLKVEDVYNEISNAQYGTTVKKIVDIARENGLKNNKLYRTVFRHCIKHEDYVASETYIRAMVIDGVVPDELTLIEIFTIFEKSNKRERVVKYHEKYLYKEKCEIETCKILLRSYKKLNAVGRLLSWMDKMGIKKDLGFYIEFIALCEESNQFKIARKLYEEIKKDNLGMNDVLCMHLMRMSSKNSNLKFALQLIEDFERNDIELSTMTLNHFFHLLAKHHTFQNAIAVYEMMFEQQKVNDETNDILTYLNGKHGNLSKVLQLFNEQPTAERLAALADALCQKQRPDEIPFFIKSHLRIAKSRDCYNKIFNHLFRYEYFKVMDEVYAQLGSHKAIDHIFYPDKQTEDSVVINKFEKQITWEWDWNFENFSPGTAFVCLRNLLPKVKQNRSIRIKCGINHAAGITHRRNRNMQINPVSKEIHLQENKIFSLLYNCQKNKEKFFNMSEFIKVAMVIRPRKTQLRDIDDYYLGVKIKIMPPAKQNPKETADEE